MKIMKNTLFLCAGIALLAATTASAQVASPATEKYYVNVNVGGQLASRTLGSSVVKPDVYDETATLASTQSVGKGVLVDFAGGYRVWRDVYAGVLVSVFGNTEDAAYTTSMPNPIFFNSPAVVSGTTSGLKRREVGINPNVTYVRHLYDKFDVSLGIGVSIIRLSQDVLNDLSYTPPSQDAAPVVAKEKATGAGVYANVDFIYNLTPRYGVGGFVRYAGASVDLPSAPDQNIGGMQAGGGIRLRF
jgi:hypothetical protein